MTSNDLLFDLPYYLKINTARWEMAFNTISSIRKELSISTCNDFGCGPGWFSKKMSMIGLRVTGIDARPELIKIAKKRVPGTKFYKTDIESKEESSKLSKADLSFCFGLLYHLESPLRAIRNIFNLTNDVFFIESMVVKEGSPISWIVEEGKNETQGLNHIAMVPSRLALIKMLYAAGFKGVYEYLGEIDHEDFYDTEKRYARRKVFLAFKEKGMLLNEFKLIDDFKATKYNYDKSI